MHPVLANHHHSALLSFAPFVLLITPIMAGELPRSELAPPKTPIVWHDDYHAGLDDAQSQQKLALLWFYPSATADDSHAPSDAHFSQPSIAALIRDRYVAIQLPTTASIESGHETTKLLDHPAFAEMRHSHGLAIIDMSDEQSPLFRQVISIYSFARGPLSSEKLSLLLDLPRG